MIFASREKVIKDVLVKLDELHEHRNILNPSCSICVHQKYIAEQMLTSEERRIGNYRLLEEGHGEKPFLNE